MISGLYLSVQIKKAEEISFERRLSEYKTALVMPEKASSMTEYSEFLPLLVIVFGFVFLQLAYLGERRASEPLKEDIDRKKLRESEKRFNDVIENALEWIWEVDVNGKYIYASPVIEKILGYKPEQIVKKKYFYDLFCPEDREELKKAALGAFAEKQPFREFINRNVHKNGEIVWLSTSGVPIFDEKGNLLGYRGADIDITERKKAEENLQKTIEELKKALEVSGRANKLMVGRELEMIGLKKEINELLKKLDQPQKH
ncbi:MAG: PAS domain S-box protein [Patescibacteria group bacterium]